MKEAHNVINKIDLLKNNYQYLFNLYRRSKFEIEIDLEIFRFYGPTGDTESSRKPSTIKPAADDLYDLACALNKDYFADQEQFSQAEKETLAEYVLRSKVLSY